MDDIITALILMQKLTHNTISKGHKNLAELTKVVKKYNLKYNKRNTILTTI